MDLKVNFSHALQKLERSGKIEEKSKNRIYKITLICLLNYLSYKLGISLESEGGKTERKKYLSENLNFRGKIRVRKATVSMP